MADDETLAGAAKSEPQSKKVREVRPITFDRGHAQRADVKDFRPVPTNPPDQRPTAQPAVVEVVVPTFETPTVAESTVVVDSTATHPSNLPPD